MKNLVLLRKNANLTQRDLSERIKIPKTNIGSYEVGKTEPSLDTLIKLADFFGCSVDYLLGHQTDNLIHIDGFSEPQKKLMKLIPQLNQEQSIYLLGRVTEILGLPYTSTKPIKPW